MKLKSNKETAINIGVATGLLAAEAKPGDRPMQLGPAVQDVRC